MVFAVRCFRESYNWGVIIDSTNLINLYQLGTNNM